MVKRLNWVDIYKGLAILLVVVGHSTGVFNPYIYQFHMAAFFFISGYTSKLSGKGVLQTAAGKAYSIYLPYFVFFLCSLGLAWLLQAAGGYSILFKDPFPGVMFSLSEFFNHRIYINLLGATWFLITLFGIYILQRIVLFLCFDRPNFFYFILSLFIFFVGYGIIKATTYIPDNIFYLIYIGQFYFSLGVIFSQKDWFAWVEKKSWSLAPILFVNLLLFFVFAHLWPNTVDYPSRNFGNAFTNAIAAVNGIIFLFGISFLLDKFKWKYSSGILVKIGQNTLGIVFFHFLFFKIVYALLAQTGVVDWSYISTFVPTPEIGRQYWWLLSGVSLSLSGLTWLMLLRIPFARGVFGQDKEILKRFFESTGSGLVKIDLAMMEKRNEFGDTLTRRLQGLHDQNRVVVIGLTILVVLAVIPWLEQGIICNDELQSRYWAQLGWRQFWNHYMGLWSSQGRTLGALLNIISMYLGFLSTNVFLFRGISILLLLSALGLFGWLVARLLKSSSLGIAVSVTCVLLLPISFEHTLPNAFVALFSLPLILALASFHLFLRYLERGKKWMLLASVTIWFIFLTGYEAFVMLTPVFVIITFVYQGSSLTNLGSVLFKCRYPLATSILFVIAYFVTLKFFPSHYSGNSIAELNFGSSSAIVQQLFKSGSPGYYLFNSKYQYLFNIYSDSFHSMGSVLAANPLAAIFGTLFPLSSVYLTNLRNMFSEPRVLALVGLSLGLVYALGRNVKGADPRIETRKLPFLLGVPIVMALLVAIPNSLGKLYQGMVNADNFSALPVTILVFGFLVFALVVLIWFLWERMSRVFSTLLLMGVVLVLVFPVQTMNGVFAQEQYRNFNRFSMLESVFDTDLLHHLDAKAIFAPDFYITKNLLGINEGYWSDYSRAKGLNLDVSSKYTGQAHSIQVLSDQQLALLSAGKVVLLSLERVDNRRLFLQDPLSINASATITLGNGVKDGIFYKYTIETSGLPPADSTRASLLTLDKNKELPVVINEGLDDRVTTNKAMYLTGFFPDGWVAKDATLKIQTGKTGKVILSGHLTIPRTKDMAIEVFADNKKIGKYNLAEENFKIVLLVNSGDMVAELSFHSNWEFDAGKPDIRKLSYLLVDLHGE